MNVGFFCALLMLLLMEFVRRLNLTVGPDPTPGFKGRTSVSSGFRTERTLISASTVPHCGITDAKDGHSTEM